MALKYKFLTEPDDSLKCLICLEVAKDPKQHENCGKLFCSECIEKNGNKPCPNCRAEHPQYFKDRRSLRETKALLVRCANVERGCDWEGTVGIFDDHVTKCIFALVSCPNKCKFGGDNLPLLRKDLDDHMKTKCPNRNYQCKSCKKMGTYTSITRVHDRVCIEKVVSCPNTKCTCTMKRGLSRQHLQTVCNYTEVPCMYASIGCEVRKMRMDMKRHEENDKSHLPLTLEKIMKLDRAISLSRNEIAPLKINMSSLASDVSSLKATTSSLKATTSSLKATTSSQKATISSLKTTILSLKDTTSSQADTISSLEDTTHFLEDTTSFLDDTASSLEDTISSLKDTFVMNDVYTRNKRKSVTFELTGYSNKKEGNEIFYSEPFYTTPSGYKMCIIIYPNGYGDGEGTHVSVYAKLLEGPYDDKLLWPFLGTVTVELLNQLTDDNHHSEMMQFDTANNGRAGSDLGLDEFFNHIELPQDSASNTHLLLDDALYFRVTVEVDNHKPWLDCTHHPCDLHLLYIVFLTIYVAYYVVNTMLMHFQN